VSETATAAARPATGRRHYGAIDGYRAVAALAIVVFHVAFLSGLGLRHPWPGLFLARLDVGVALFFVLSGFLLYRPFAVAHLRSTATPDLRRFYGRRLLRIVPAYWVTLVVVAYVLHQNPIRGLGDVVTYFGFLQIYSKSHLNGGISQAWSLCTEMSFYLALPLWAWAVRGAACRRGTSALRAEVAGVAGLYLSGLALRAAIALGGLRRPIDIRLDWLPLTADLFALGMALAVATAWAEGGGRLPAPVDAMARRPWACWSCAGAAYVVVAMVVFRRRDLGEPMTAGQVMGREVLYGVVAVLLVLPGVIGPERAGAIRRGMHSRVLMWLGLISYGIYLTHNAVLDQAFTSGHLRPMDSTFAPLLAVTAGGAVVAAVALHLLIERPALRLKERLER